MILLLTPYPLKQKFWLHKFFQERFQYFGYEEGSYTCNGTRYDHEDMLDYLHHHCML